jgi:putative PIG3 family NAD(P)H quinone oxidoreductase
MKAIDVARPGGPEALELVDVPDLEPGPGEVRVRVRATAVNRADLLQRRGLYPPPPGASKIIGLEMAGEVDRLGAGVSEPRLGERVCALLTGGGYAEQAVIPAGMAMRVPDALSFEQAAAFPEVWMTAWDNLIRWGRLAAGETALVHGGGSGVGTAAVQIARFVGARAIATVGSPEKGARVVALGADAFIDYKTEDFAARARELTGGRGVDVILDIMGGAYLEKNVRALAVGGRLVCIGLMGGAQATLDLGQLLSRRLTVAGTTLRSRPVAEKIALTREVEARLLPEIAAGRLKLVVDRVLPLARAADAHRALEASEHFGKIVLAVR